MMAFKRPKLKRVLTVIIISVLVFCILSFGVTKLVYDGIFARYDDALEVTGGERHTYGGLSGYYFDGGARRCLVVLSPGFHASVAGYMPQIEYLCDMGYGVFAFDPTGSCTSEGDSHIGFSQQIQDVETTLKYIEKNKNFGYNDIVLMGHSRGAYAICCADKSGADVAAVVTLSGVNSAMEGVIGSSEKYVGFLAYGNYGFLWLYQTLLFGADTVNMSAADEIVDSGIPTLVIHGEEDETYPCDKNSIISYRDKIGDSAEFYVETADGRDGHGNIMYDGDGVNKPLFDRICGFIENALND